MAPQITLADVTQHTNQEWNNDWDVLNAQTTTTQPNTVVEQTPAALVPNPTKAMSCLTAAHLQAQATPAAVPIPAVAQAGIKIESVGANYNTNATIAGLSPTTSHGSTRAVSHIKTALPRKYMGDPSHACIFPVECEIYFIPNPMAPERLIRFILPPINSDGKYWKTTSLSVLGAVPPLLWSQNWDLFNAVRDTCQKAGWNDQTQWRGVVRYGLEREMITVMAGRFLDRWDDFVAAIIKIGEDLQR